MSNVAYECIQFDKVTSRIDKLCYGLDMNYVDPIEVTQKVVQGVHRGVTTVELDNLATEVAGYLTTRYPDYAILAARIAVSNLHKETKNLSDDSFGLKTLERSYLIRLNGRIAERPQRMIMRVAVGIHGDDIEHVLQTYNLMFERYFTHATPAVFNAGTPLPQMSSCFLVCMKDASIEVIYDILKDCALISKSAGGIGISIHNIRATGSYIAGTNGYSNGFVLILQAHNTTARHVTQGDNKRPGAFAIYLEPWHVDILAMINLRKNYGKEEVRAHDLFYALWIPDLFMKRVEGGGNWSLFCPSETPGLHEVYGDDFEALYECYEQEGRTRETPRNCAKSNQKNLGVIKSSNLCTEIVEYSSLDETAVCNLASLALPTYNVKDASGKPFSDFQKLHDITKTAHRSNMRNRPSGIEVQVAKWRNGPYETWMGSPALQRQLQFDLWRVTPTNLWDWNTLKDSVSKCGMRNSLLTAPMHTASTSQMLGSSTNALSLTRAFLPLVSEDLVDLGLWDDAMKNMLIAHHGSVQNIPAVPDNIKSIYKTVWEILQKKVLDLAADCGAFICQRQSLNVLLASPSMGQLMSMYFYGWKKGLKTGMYYLRTKPAAQAERPTAQEGNRRPLSHIVLLGKSNQIIAVLSGVPPRSKGENWKGTAGKAQDAVHEFREQSSFTDSQRRG
ncbi:hypothetical protein C8J55DRAFT_538380 [Lentinula edodes]|uniref:Ribonucleoside-diphosphate reductase n=1 Tax=Lentinula lateritia TaxID=40482 RepID=A0A9W9DFA2_9AGAR|nr:hypothetical protein C8J55DRAFT_538380 [Lentinula edodes]